MDVAVCIPHIIAQFAWIPVGCLSYKIPTQITLYVMQFASLLGMISIHRISLAVDHSGK